MMNVSIALLVKLSVALGVAYVFSMFGSRLPASRATVWWIGGIFLIVAIVSPGLLVPLADLLGFELVSNFILASIAFFLFIEVLGLSETSATTERRLRRLISVTAAGDFTPGDRQGATRVLVALPCYNEAENLPNMIPRLEALIQESTADLSLHYCFFDDGSADRSRDILMSRAPGHVVSHPVNIGVAGVLMTAFTTAQRYDFDYVVQCDSDGQHPTEDIPRLVREALSSGADLTIGSRYVKGEQSGNAVESTTLLRAIGTRLISWLLALAWPGFSCKDTTSGLRVYSRRAMTLLLKNMPDAYPEPESLAIAATHKLKVIEVPVTMRPREAGQSTLAGWRSAQFMTKVFAAIIGMRIRAFWGRPS